MTNTRAVLDRERLVSKRPFVAGLELRRWLKDPAAKDSADIELAIAIREREAGLTRSYLSIVIAVSALFLAFAAVIFQVTGSEAFVAVLFFCGCLGNDRGIALDFHLRVGFECPD